MKSSLLVIPALLLLMSGCHLENDPAKVAGDQSNVSPRSANPPEVVNTHGNIENLKRLDLFVENARNNINDQIDYVQYGIEGQKGIRSLTYGDGQLKVEHHVDGEFVESYSCKNIQMEEAEKEMKYTLTGCTGSFQGDFELLRVPQ
ncbi:DUF4362 domain-containing protein [Falsibacillus pallidus]|uniref:DUF4362 domain-containing protein n=1 Tax=Falsibacillus pallidus TaxID=493781 RepID=UPI003D991693